MDGLNTVYFRGKEVKLDSTNIKQLESYRLKTVKDKENGSTRILVTLSFYADVTMLDMQDETTWQ